MKRVHPEPNTGCWFWVGKTSTDGYGQLHHKCSDGFLTAHRYSYFLHFGDFDRTKYVLHKCDNRLCVNPDHLYLGDSQQNVKDRTDRNRGAKFPGSSNGFAKLNEATVISMRNDYRRGGITHRGIAKKYSVSFSTAQKILLRTRWTHI